MKKNKKMKSNDKELTSDPRFLFVIQLTAIIITLYLAYNVLLGAWSTQWNETVGKINLNRIEKEYVYRGNHGRTGTRVTEEIVENYLIKYSYTVGNKYYTNSRISYFDSICELNENSATLVYYNKFIPYLSVIKNGVRIDVGTIILILVWMIELSIILFYKASFRKSIKNL